jgi:hypothetical protein
MNQPKALPVWRFLLQVPATRGAGPPANLKEPLVPTDTPAEYLDVEFNRVLEALARYLNRHWPPSEHQEVRFRYIDLVRELDSMGVRLTDAQAARLLVDGAFRLDTARLLRGSLLTPELTADLLATGFQLSGDDYLVTTRPQWDDYLARRAEGAAVAKRAAGEGASAAAPAAASGDAPVAAETCEQIVTTGQVASLLQIHNKTLLRHINAPGSAAPDPVHEGGGGRAHLWSWSQLSPWLEREFPGRRIPARFPSLNQSG